MAADSQVWHFVILSMFLGTKHDLREWARSCPLTLALSPNTENVLGEREQMVGWGTPVLPQWLLPLAGPWATA